jgi:ABC-type oligopeptide transport system ATPase subunit
VRGLTKHFAISGGLRGAAGTVRAVEEVSFDIRRGEALGLVGESGCGKSTLGRMILRLEAPTSGEIRFEGTDLAKASRKEPAPWRRRIQAIFQDPFSWLNPRIAFDLNDARMLGGSP